MTGYQNKFQWLVDYVMRLSEKSMQRSDECYTTNIMRRTDTKNYPYAKWLHSVHDPFDLSPYPNSYLDYGHDIEMYVLRHRQCNSSTQDEVDTEVGDIERKFEEEARAWVRQEALRRRKEYGTEGIDRWHPEYVDMLNATNGISLFAATISICGIKRPHPNDVIRLGEKTRKLHPCIAVGLACRIGEFNWSKFYPGREASEMVIGFYGLDASLIFQCVRSGEIIRRLRDKPEIVNRWPSLEYFLRSEVKRLECLFDGNGNFLANDETRLLSV